MLYYLPDARDVVDPTFDFEAETRSIDRIRSRDDQYAHEVYGCPPYDGMLVSLALVEGAGSRYTAPERRRLYREGFRAFVRGPKRLRVLGDCGAFSYRCEFEPPYSIHDVAEFYARTRVDAGFALDHLVLGYDDGSDGALFDLVDPEWRRRQSLTLELAADFWRATRDVSFEPIGVAQGWSPASYAGAVEQLQRIGYSYIALGGIIPLSTEQVVDVLRRVTEVRRPDTRLHLLGVSRPGNLAEFARLGVYSFDSTSPLRRAWMDGRHNYWIGPASFTALRIPESNSPKIAKRIMSGELDGDEVRALEERALETLARYATNHTGFKAAHEALFSYNEVHSPGADRRDDYFRTLTERPWERCPCRICRHLGHHVILLRGAERSRRRGFHNVWQFHQTMRRELDRLHTPKAPSHR